MYLTTGSDKDKAAVEERELNSLNLEPAANDAEFLAEYYLGPSWNAFISAWK